MNETQLIGRLTKAAKITNFESGNKCAAFTLATNRGYKNKDGDYVTYFVPCLCWGRTAEVIENYTRKGSKIAAKGYIQTRSYTNSKNVKVYVTETVVESVELLEKKKTESDPIEEGFDFSEFNEDDDEVPF